MFRSISHWGRVAATVSTAATLSSAWPDALSGQRAEQQDEALADGGLVVRDHGGTGSVFCVTPESSAGPAEPGWPKVPPARGGWAGGVSAWLGSAWRESSPFITPWRRDRGGLWDVGPHMISLLWASLGPVTSVAAEPGPADVAHLVLRHRGGATSTTTVTLSAAEAAAGFEAYVWGESGGLAAPEGSDDPVTALGTGLCELAANARAGQTRQPCDVRFGRDVGAAGRGATPDRRGARGLS